MYYTAIFLFMSAISIFTSFPVAIQHSIPYIDIVTDYLAYMTFSGCLCALIMLIARYATKANFNPNKKIFKVPMYEQKFYEKIKIDKWKKIVPDFGKMVGFKKKINPQECKNADFYERFLYENINASILHFTDILLTPIFFIFLRPEFYVTIGLCGLLTIFILNIIPVMLQRYLRPRLLKIYNKLKAKESLTTQTA